MSTPPYDPTQQYPQPGGDPYGVPASPGPYTADNPYATPGYQQQGYQQPTYQQAGYAAPGYAAPGYPPSGYQQPYYPQGYAYQPLPASATTNTMAILSLVFAFIFAPLGVVFGHMAKRQIRERGEGGEGLATAGLVVGYVFTGLFLVGCAIDVALFGAFFHAASTVDNTP